MKNKTLVLCVLMAMLPYGYAQDSKNPNQKTDTKTFVGAVDTKNAVDVAKASRIGNTMAQAPNTGGQAGVPNNKAQVDNPTKPDGGHNNEACPLPKAREQAETTAINKVIASRVDTDLIFNGRQSENGQGQDVMGCFENTKRVINLAKDIPKIAGNRYEDLIEQVRQSVDKKVEIRRDELAKDICSIADNATVAIIDPFLGTLGKQANQYLDNTYNNVLTNLQPFVEIQRKALQIRDGLENTGTSSGIGLLGSLLGGDVGKFFSGVSKIIDSTQGQKQSVQTPPTATVPNPSSPSVSSTNTGALTQQQFESASQKAIMGDHRELINLTKQQEQQRQQQLQQQQQQQNTNSNKSSTGDNKNPYSVSNQSSSVNNPYTR